MRHSAAFIRPLGQMPELHGQHRALNAFHAIVEADFVVVVSPRRAERVQQWKQTAHPASTAGRSLGASISHINSELLCRQSRSAALTSGAQSVKNVAAV